MTIPKFRAWFKREQRMIESYDILAIDYENEEIVTQKIYSERGLAIERDIHSYDFDDVNLMQSTGLIDKNGKEIFEGDIVAVDNGDFLEYGRVFYSKKMACYRVKFENYDFGLNEVTYCFVCGNVYENPELLEEEA